MNMDILSVTTENRKILLEYIKPMCSVESQIWVRNVLSDINHRLVRENNEYITSQTLMLYRNILPFFKDWCSELTASNILFTIYSVAVELGVREMGDIVEELSEFQEDLDMDDWGLVSKSDIIDFDIRTAQLCILHSKGKLDEDIYAGGLHTLQTIDFIRSTAGRST